MCAHQGNSSHWCLPAGVQAGKGSHLETVPGKERRPEAVEMFPSRAHKPPAPARPKGESEPTTDAPPKRKAGRPSKEESRPKHTQGHTVKCHALGHSLQGTGGGAQARMALPTRSISCTTGSALPPSLSAYCLHVCISLCDPGRAPGEQDRTHHTIHIPACLRGPSTQQGLSEHVPRST